MYYHWGQTSAKKKGTWSLWTSYIKQASSVGVTLTVVGWNNSSAICIASSESCEPKRFVRCRNKVEIYIQEQQPNQLHCYKQNMGFVNRMDQHVTKYWYPNEKIVVFPACLNGVCLLFRVNGYCVVLTKIKTMNLASSSFRRHVVNVIFLKYSKEGRLSSNHLGIRNIWSDVCYDGTKHYQVQSEHRRIQDLFKYLRGSVSA